MSDQIVSEPDFVERNGAFLLSLVGMVGACISGLLAYFLRSRCRTIKCCGCECERDVLDANLAVERQLPRPLRTTRIERRVPRTEEVKSSGCHQQSHELCNSN
jgi:hypothetical protein